MYELHSSFYYRRTPLTYDFTAVTDIAVGICNALKHMTKTCGVVYDLGSGRPQKVTTAADILKKKLKKSSKNVRILHTCICRSMYELFDFICRLMHCGLANYI